MPDAARGRRLFGAIAAGGDPAAAGKAEARAVSLRHSFASIGAAANSSLLILDKLLGHRHAGTAERYSHLSANPQAAEPIGQRISSALACETATDLGPLPPWRPAG